MGPPAWIEHAIWWHVYPLGFAGADTTGRVRRPTDAFTRLTAWLDYAIELGLSGVALGPIFQSETHGYDTLDYFRIDDRLGTEDEFRAFCEEARRRGLRILLDGVFNHTARAFPAPFPGWFSGGVFEGHEQLAGIDHTRPEVVDYVAGVMNHWLERGAAGWRLDAAYAVAPSFWASVTAQVTSAHPDAYLFGEMIHGDYAAAVEASGFHSVTQYELWKAVWSALNDGNFFELAWALRRNNELLDTFVPVTFIGNHDVTRIASKLTEARHLPIALAVLLTVAGTPCVYYGDEQAFRGVKEDRAGGDDAVRPAFPPEPSGLAPDGWPVYRLHQELIGLRRRHPWLHGAPADLVEVANRRLEYELGGRLRVILDLDSDPGWEILSR